MKIVEKLEDDLYLCEIPDVGGDVCFLKLDGKEYVVRLNANYVNSFSELRGLGWQYVPVIKLPKGLDGFVIGPVDSILICKEPKNITLHKFLSEYNDMLRLERYWFVVKDTYLYLFGWWD